MEDESRRQESERTTRSQGKKKPMNDGILQMLEKIRDHYRDVNDQGRKIAYNKAIGFLRTYEKPIEDADELDQLPTIG